MLLKSINTWTVIKFCQIVTHAMNCSSIYCLRKLIEVFPHMQVERDESTTGTI